MFNNASNSCSPPPSEGPIGGAGLGVLSLPPILFLRPAVDSYSGLSVRMGLGGGGGSLVSMCCLGTYLGPTLTVLYASSSNYQ